MRQQIIKVNDIEKSIREVGLKYYVDRLLQDELGDYYWVETKAVESEHGPYDQGWTPYKEVVIGPAAIGDLEDMESTYFYQYRVAPIPLAIAWFIIDALKLQSDVMGIGTGSYDEGPHGGRLKYYSVQDVNGKTRVEEIDKDVVRIEEL